MAATTTANGVYFDCGYGKPVGVNITCSGPSCPALDSFPNLVCTSNSLTTNCNNKVTSCPENSQPNFRSLFTIVQQADGTLDENQSLTIDGNKYSVSDLNGQVSYGPNPSTTTTSTSVGATQTIVTTVPATTSRVSASSSANQLSIPRCSKPRLLFGLIVVFSLLAAQIQAHSVPASGIICNMFIAGTVIYPLIWSQLSVGVRGQCSGLGTYVNVCILRKPLSQLVRTLQLHLPPAPHSQ